MGLFKKNKKEEERKSEIPNLPELPKLPELSHSSENSLQFPSIKEFPGFTEKETLPQLPSFPNNSLGDKFSQNTIKEAVSGKKEAEERADEELQMIPSSSKEFDFEQEPALEKIQGKSAIITPRVTKAEPVFIRLDKFEESLNLFSKLKEEIQDVQELLDATKKLKEQEDKELEAWQQEMQSMKKQIEKIDEDLFSKI